MASFERMLTWGHLVVGDSRYKIIRKIGGGSFGDIFLALSVVCGEVIITLVFIFFSFLTQVQWLSRRSVTCILGYFVLEYGGRGVFLSYNFLSSSSYHFL